MDSAPETLPIVRCPGCEEPMQPKSIVPVTRELDDISYVCPKCGAASGLVKPAEMSDAFLPYFRGTGCPRDKGRSLPAQNGIGQEP